MSIRPKAGPLRSPSGSGAEDPQQRYLKGRERARNALTTPRTTAPWYTVTDTLTSTDTATIHLFDDIGVGGISSQQFAAGLAAVTAGTIDVRINSAGGSVFDGLAIMQSLKDHPARIHVHVDSLAASIASVIAMAGDKITTARNSMWMVHEASGLAIGDSREMRKLAALLDRCSANIADVYSQRTGRPVAYWQAAMREETWFTGAEAVAAGLADEVGGVTDEAWTNSVKGILADLGEQSEWAAITRRLTN